MGFTELTQDFPELSQVPQPGAQLDYSRWQQGSSKIILHCVPWSSSYTDVIGFASDTARDSWFDDATTHERLEIQQTAYIPYGTDKCRVELSSARVSQFNYVEVRTEAAPTQTNPFTGQVPPGPTRAYYFMRSFEQLAPDTCEIKLSLDVWTTHIHSFVFGSCWLNRGHVGVEETDVETYLSNPNANSEWLLAPDVSYSSADMVANVDMCSMWQGACSVVVGIRANQTWLESAPTLTISGSAIISFYDVANERWGADAGCTASVPALLSPVNLPSADYDANLQSVHYYKVADPTTFFETVEQSYAYVFQLIESVYAVPSAMITIGQEFTALGSTLALITALPDVTQNITLSKTDFGFDSSVADFAKLYTYPYSVLEYETCDGNTHEIRVENTGASFGFASRIAEIDNYLQLQTYLNDANGFGSFDYYWKDNPKTLPKGVATTLTVRGIPSYELIITERHATAAERVRDLAQKCREIETTYTNGARAENTVEQNTLDINATNYNNAVASNATTATNATAASNTALATGNAAAAAAATNAYTAADTAKTIAYAESNTVKLNTDDTVTAMVNNAEHTRLANNQLKGNAQDENYLKQQAATTKISDDADADVDYQTAAVNAQLTGVAAAGSTSNIAAAGTTAVSALSGAAVGSVVPGVGTAAGAIVGALFSASGHAIAGVSAAVSNTIVITKEQAIGDASLANIAAKRDNAIAFVNATNGYARTKAENDTSASNSLISNQTMENRNATNSISARNLTTTQTNADTANASAKTIADLTNTTTQANNAAINATELANIGRTQTTADTIAANAKSTGDANAIYARDAAILNLQDSARTNYAGLTTELESAGLKKHREITSGSNQEAYNFDRAFDTVKIKTQNKDAILQAGKYFDMYGYAANREYVPSSNAFSLQGRNKTYWKFDDVRGYNTSGGNGVRDLIFNVLKNGVTVWASPEVIYDAQINP